MSTRSTGIEFRATVLSGVIGVLIDHEMTAEDIKTLFSPKNIEAGYQIIIDADARRAAPSPPADQGAGE